MKKKIALITFFILLIGQNVSSNTVYVIDADTIKIGNEKIRFSGIDAPELNQDCFKNERNERCWDDFVCLACVCARTCEEQSSSIRSLNVC